MKRMLCAAAKKLDVVGWRELVALPDFGIATMRAKIDTGARTSALHAVNLDEFERDGVRWVRFRTPTSGLLRDEYITTRVLDERDVKNTSGVPEKRLFVKTTLLLGRHHWRIEVSLANREKMEFDLILGRSALRRRGVVVDPGRSYLVGSPPSGRDEGSTSRSHSLGRHTVDARVNRTAAPGRSGDSSS